MFILIKEKLNR